MPQVHKLTAVVEALEYCAGSLLRRSLDDEDALEEFLQQETDIAGGAWAADQQDQMTALMAMG